MTTPPKILAYLVEGVDAPFSAIVFSDSAGNALRAGEQGFEAIWGTRGAVKVSRLYSYDSKYAPGMKVNECLDQLVVYSTWSNDPS